MENFGQGSLVDWESTVVCVSAPVTFTASCQPVAITTLKAVSSCESIPLVSHISTVVLTYLLYHSWLFPRQPKVLHIEEGKEERLKMLCELAANERDSQKLLELIREICDLIDKKRQHSISVASSE